MTTIPGIAPLWLILVRLANGLGKPFGIDPFPRAFPNEQTAREDRVDQVFDRIYRTNYWSSNESRSGVGSEESFSSRYREQLRDCLADYQLNSIFDAPCGDLNWIAPLACDPTLAYEGGDVSEAAIASCRSKFPAIAVRQFDICEGNFPKADVWHCRDCLFHLPFAHVRRALLNYANSSIPFALLTTHRSRIHRNLDVNLGGFRYLDLELHPISLPKPIAYLKDFRWGRDFPRFVGLWSRQDIQDALKGWMD